VLPNTITISQELLKFISKVEEFNGAWRLIQELSPDQLNQLRRVATFESVGSSTRIEGAKLSDQEVEALLGRIGIKDFRSRDEQEVAGYAFVMEEIFEAYTEMELTENLLFQLHRDLLRYSEKDERHRGNYKSLPNHVSAFDADGKEIGVVFQTASPFETPQRMEELIAWNTRQDQSGGLHPLLRIGIFVVTFLAIHPFQDGNGRLSRVLTTLLMLKAGYTYVPYSSMESIIEENKEGYYLALRRTQSTIYTDQPDWEPWLLFFARTLAKQVLRLHERMEGATEGQDHEQNISPLAEKILAELRAKGAISVGQATDFTEANRNTVKAKLQELVEAGLAQLRGRGRGAHYVPTDGSGND
jgi:Fic family protein